MSDFRSYRMDSFPPVVKNLLIINVLVFIAQLVLGAQFHITEILSLYPIMPEKLHEILVESRFYEAHQKFEPYQVATHMFAHSPGVIFHIIFNMFALWMFGRILENRWGGKRFLFFYLVCGVGAAACHLAIQYIRCEDLLSAIQANIQFSDPSPKELQNAVLSAGEFLGAASPALGASGAIMGIFAAFAFLFPNTELFIMFIPFPVKAKWVVLGLVALDLFGGIFNFSGDNVAHFAHLGGAITGFIIVLFWNRTNRRRFY
jgi:membrane associated rhomboid family serine protease